VSRAALLAALAGGLGVLAGWELLAAVEASALVQGLGRALAPLVRARREGREPSPPERRRLAVLAAAGAFAAGWLVAGPLPGLVLALAGPWAVLALVRARRRRWLAEVQDGAPLVARALSDALAGGHSVRGAVSAAAAGGGLTGPAGAQLRKAAADLALGEPTELALERLRARARGRAFDTIVAAVLLQREAGGDLAGLLRGVAEALEDAARVRRDARTATAQARFTGVLVAALPAGAAALAELASPGYVGRLAASPLTIWLAGAAIALHATALVLIARLARVTP
jgi:tight adherence protein B